MINWDEMGTDEWGNRQKEGQCRPISNSSRNPLEECDSLAPGPPEVIILKCNRFEHVGCIIMEESLWKAAGSTIPDEIQLPPLQLRFCCRRTPPANGHPKISFAALKATEAVQSRGTKGLFLCKQLRVEPGMRRFKMRSYTTQGSHKCHSIVYFQWLNFTPAMRGFTTGKG